MLCAAYFASVVNSLAMQTVVVPTLCCMSCRAAANGMTVQRWRKDARALEREEEVCILLFPTSASRCICDTSAVLRCVGVNIRGCFHRCHQLLITTFSMLQYELCTRIAISLVKVRWTVCCVLNLHSSWDVTMVAAFSDLTYVPPAVAIPLFNAMQCRISIQ